MTNLRQIIRESIQEYIREIDEAGDIAALEAKITKTQEAIDKRKKLSSKDGLDEEYHAFLDERKMKEMTSEIKHLEKSLGKYNKTLEKLKSKASWNDQERGLTWNSQQIDVDGELEEMTTDPAEETSAQLEDKDTMNEEQVLYMQKIAGIISETEYKAKLEEAKKKASAGLTKKQKSTISKKAHAGKDIGKKGKGFEKVAKAGEKQYGSKEAGEKVAAAAMWKNAAKKAKGLKEEVQALFEDGMTEGRGQGTTVGKLLNMISSIPSNAFISLNYDGSQGTEVRALNYVDMEGLDGLASGEPEIILYGS
jgi:hypothetical protein